MDARSIRSGAKRLLRALPKGLLQQRLRDGDDMTLFSGGAVAADRSDLAAQPLCSDVTAQPPAVQPIFGRSPLFTYLGLW